MVEISHLLKKIQDKETKETLWPPKDLSLPALQSVKNPKIKNLYKNYKEYIATAQSFGAADYSIVSFAFAKQTYRNLELSPDDYQELFEICVPENGKWSAEPLAILAQRNKSEGVHLTQEQINYLADNTDVNKHLNSYRVCPIASIFSTNIYEQINLNKARIDNLLAQTDLEKEYYTDYSALNAAICFNKMSQLGLTHAQFDYLIEKSKHCKPINQNDESLSTHCVISAFASLGNNASSLSFEQIDTLFKSSGLDIEKIESFKIENKKIKYILSFFNAPPDIYSKYYQETIMAGYNEFKPEKLKKLAIEKEKQSLNILVPTLATNRPLTSFKI